MEEFQPRDEKYLAWLCGLLGIKDISCHPNGVLLRLLYGIEFHLTDPVIGHDDNRVSDAYSLRGDYLDSDLNCEIPVIFMGAPSVLEVLIALSLRIDDDVMYNGELRASKWFWIMISNLKMMDFTNESNGVTWSPRDVTAIIDIWMNRCYDFNGNGGLFPLKYTAFDQREVEIWYQMQSYFEEN